MSKGEFAQYLPLSKDTAWSIQEWGLTALQRNRPGHKNKCSTASAVTAAGSGTPREKLLYSSWDSRETPAKSRGQSSPKAAALSPSSFPLSLHSTKMSQKSSDLLEAPQKISAQHQISRGKWALVLRTTVLLRSSSISTLRNVGHVNDDQFYLSRHCFGEEGCITW